MQANKEKPSDAFKQASDEAWYFITVDDIKSIRNYQAEYTYLQSDSGIHTAFEKSRMEDLDKKISGFYSFYSTVIDADIRLIIKLRFIEGKSWRATARSISSAYCTGDAARKRWERWADKHLPWCGSSYC